MVVLKCCNISIWSPSFLNQLHDHKPVLLLEAGHLLPHGRDDPAQGGEGSDVGGRLNAGFGHGRDDPNLYTGLIKFLY